MTVINSKNIKLKNGLTLTLRSPKPSDAQILLNHLKKVSHQSYKNMNHPKNFWDNFSIDEERKILSDFETSNTNFILSAFYNEKIVRNLGCFGTTSEFAKFNARIGMGIEKDFHNLGLGAALLNYAIESAKQNKIHRLELTVRTFNERGITLYEKVGFRRVGILKDAAFIDECFYDEYIYELLIND